MAQSIVLAGGSPLGHPDKIHLFVGRLRRGRGRARGGRLVQRRAGAHRAQLGGGQPLLRPRRRAQRHGVLGVLQLHGRVVRREREPGEQLEH
jgi:hypothetical protein